MTLTFTIPVWLLWLAGWSAVGMLLLSFLVCYLFTVNEIKDFRQEYGGLPEKFDNSVAGSSGPAYITREQFMRAMPGKYDPAYLDVTDLSRIGAYWRIFQHAIRNYCWFLLMFILVPFFLAATVVSLVFWPAVFLASVWLLQKEVKNLPLFYEEYQALERKKVS